MLRRFPLPVAQVTVPTGANRVSFFYSGDTVLVYQGGVRAQCQTIQKLGGFWNY